MTFVCHVLRRILNACDELHQEVRVALDVMGDDRRSVEGYIWQGVSHRRELGYVGEY